MVIRPVLHGASFTKWDRMLRIRRNWLLKTVRVPASNLLGEEGQGFKYMMEKLARERLEVCVKCQAMAELAFKEGLEYAKVREAFKKPIGNFQHNCFQACRNGNRC